MEEAKRKVREGLGIDNWAKELVGRFKTDPSVAHELLDKQRFGPPRLKTVFG